MNGILFLIFLFSVSANANVGDAYGFGSRSSALAGAVVAWGADGFAAYSNPALLAYPDNKRVIVSYGTLFVSPSFYEIDSVVTENNFNSDGVRKNSVSTRYRETFGQALGVTLRIFPQWKNFSLGFVSYFPMGRSFYFDSGEAFIPEYVLYRSRTQRPFLNLGAGLSLGQIFSIGVGVQFSFSLTSKVDTFIHTDTKKASSMRVVSSLKPKLGPYLGFLLNSREKTNDEAPHWSLGLVFRLPVNAPAYFQVGTGSRAISGVAALDVHFFAMTFLQYDPLSVEIGSSAQVLEKLRAFLQLEYQRWQDYKKPAVEIQSCPERPCGITIAHSGNPNHPFRSIMIPKVGLEHQTFNQTTLRMSYAFRPGILKPPSSNSSSNYLDPSKHIFNLGSGFHFKKFFGRDIVSRLDLHFTYHKLITQHVTKTASDEIGYPGYSAGGNIYGGGISLNLEL